MAFPGHRRLQVVSNSWFVRIGWHSRFHPGSFRRADHQGRGFGGFLNSNCGRRSGNLCQGFCLSPILALVVLSEFRGLSAGIGAAVCSIRFTICSGEDLVPNSSHPGLVCFARRVDAAGLVAARFMVCSAADAGQISWRQRSMAWERHKPTCRSRRRQSKRRRTSAEGLPAALSFRPDTTLSDMI